MKQKIYEINIILVLVIIAIILCGIDFIVYNKNEETNIIEENKNYILKIDYPNLRNAELNETIRNDIDTFKKEFLDEIEGIECAEGEKFDFTSSYTMKTFHQIDSINITIYYFSGGNHYLRYDKSYHYNNETDENLELEDFLVEKSKVEDLKKVSHKYIKKYFETINIEYDKDSVDLELKQFQGIFDNFYFNELGLNIIFPSCSIAPSYTGEIYITIPYKELINILKKEYIAIPYKDLINSIKKEYKEENNEEKYNKERNLKEFKGKKLIAFTFDDGPNKSTTNKLLDNLDKYNARVTFFVLGSRINSHKDTLSRAYKMGNQIGNHSYAHPNLTKLESTLASKEINDTNKAIKNILGVEPKLLRPPYGSINKELQKLTSMNMILWNVDTEDWKYRDKYKVKENIVNNARDGAVVLLHDLYESSVEGALLAMEELQKQGYAFVTIDEMAQLKNIKLSKNKIYYNFYK